METAQLISPYVIPGIKQPQPEPEPEEDRLIKAISSEFSIPEDKFIDYISNPTRLREVVMPRQIIQSTVKFSSYMTLAEVGFKYGQKDHATVLNSCKKIRNLYQTDKRFRKRLDRILEASQMQRIRKCFQNDLVKIT